MELLDKKYPDDHLRPEKVKVALKFLNDREMVYNHQEACPHQREDFDDDGDYDKFLEAEDQYEQKMNAFKDEVENAET